ncbi:MULTISPECIES: nucleoside recognition domain-containing protein [Anaerotruncus]|uniref:Spore maturation protein A n=2 Tax=Anaerotruncus TaxID=244127 RepID=A0A498CRW7_9FIRM|nr:MULTISPECIES: nucleoside recognition domain-containing protein [Anaerotruncus]MBC3939966.1 spore maturation protein A [Anaerotruncus massiliensis (ex Togo et al. 2019)]MCQ4896966.1 spore maturation protein A [Anaerotruncus sp. DFI.9.16]RLL06927.1 spore maturation protein A [Anaerotruncus massiliensis (ex Liu et al. 2021)]
MMNVIFAGIILFSFVFAALTGRMPQLSEAAMGQAGEAVTLVLSLTGMLCLWSGLMKIAQESGLTELLSRLLSPVTKRLFKGLRPNGEAVNAITMNLIANFLGLGNAATPLGIRAMCEMAKEQRADGAATNDMAMFVVVNTASIQLIPATTAMLRMQAGSAAPLDILPATWIASVGSVAAGIVMAGLLASLWRKRP